MRKCSMVLAMVIFPFLAISTPFPSDILIYGKDTLSMSANPLYQRPGFDTLRVKLHSQNGGISKGSGRYYVAEWRIIENELYLTNIFSHDYQTSGIKVNLKALFGNECKNGMVKAFWVNGDIAVPMGKLLYYIHMAYDSLYERELVLSFENGELTHQQLYENTGSHKSYFTNPYEVCDTLKTFIYRRINWKKIPKLKQRILVRIYFESGAKLKPEKVTIVKTANEEVLNEEIVEALNLLPDWEVYYKRDKLYVAHRRLLIWFDEEIRDIYARK